MNQRVAVIGAGWAGLACAQALTKAPGLEVTVLEAAPQIGGRARSLAWTPINGGETITIDNGQHMLVGAYSQTLALLTALNVNLPAQLDRFPVTLASTDGLALQAAKLPAPWHLLLGALRSTGIGFGDFLALGRLKRCLQQQHFAPPSSQTVSELLDQVAATTLVRERLMRPLCLATLNTPMPQASARIFSAVLRDTIFASAQASDFLVARHGLSALFCDALETDLREHNVAINTGARVRQISKRSASAALLVRLHQDDTIDRHFDSVVLATPLASVPSLLSPEKTDGVIHAACSTETESIVTLYCYWQPGTSAEHAAKAIERLGARPLRLPLMLNDTIANSPGQWLFDHGPSPHGGRWMAVVISAADAHLSNQQISTLCVAQLARELGLTPPNEIKCIRERKATFRASPQCARPSNTAFQFWHPRLFLAGDYTIADYPATLESAVRSGQAAAAALLQS